MSARNAARLSDVVGDIITVNIDRGSAYRMWTGDISTDLGYLRGIENLMLDMLDNPGWLHRLVKFMLQYQLPILDKFGLVAYGCCEDLTNKIGILRKLRNLRRIAVSPFANVARCAEQIGQDCVISYRPSPADMVSYGFDKYRIRSILRRDLQACKECHFGCESGTISAHIVGFETC